MNCYIDKHLEEKLKYAACNVIEFNMACDFNISLDRIIKAIKAFNKKFPLDNIDTVANGCIQLEYDIGIYTEIGYCTASISDDKYKNILEALKDMEPIERTVLFNILRERPIIPIEDNTEEWVLTDDKGINDPKIRNVYSHIRSGNIIKIEFTDGTFATFSNHKVGIQPYEDRLELKEHYIQIKLPYNPLKTPRILVVQAQSGHNIVLTDYITVRKFHNMLVK
ncbi:hypothetical protein [Clostridium tertium]|uniref:hypothetical protein n=1 Tax=Clostridium tertium TaxID=1559 RepID=UPI0023B30905|nr:hypothetical protein [Clostridium tertium]